MPDSIRPISEIPKWKLPFNFYDPVRSFEQNDQRILLDDSGREVGTAELWELGKDAYEILNKVEPEPFTKEELIEAYLELEFVVIEMLGLINYKAGILLHNSDSDEYIDFADWAKDVECTDALIVLKNGWMEHYLNPGKHPDPLSKYLNTDFSYALCILVEIDNAVLSIFSEDWHGYSYSFGLAQSLSTFIKSTEMLKQQATKRAIKAANARHKENREMRQDAISYYEKNKENFKSRAAAARFIANSIVPVIERTVDGWLKQHLDAQSARKL